MPILDVEIVGELPAKTKVGLARRLADSAAEVLSSAPQGTWVKLRFLPREHYAENADGPPTGTLPVFVSVLLAERPVGGALRDQVRDLTQAIARACGRKTEEVHLLYQQAAKGRISFGGKLRS